LARRLLLPGAAAAVVLAVVVVVLLLPAGDGGSGPATGGGPRPSRAGGRPPGTELGVATPTLAGVDDFARRAGRRPDVYVYYQAWSLAPTFDAALAQRVTDRGMLPEVTWEPWDPFAGPEQPAYALDRIARGDCDGYVRRWATAIRDWGKPLRLRFAHEMNGSSYPWCAGRSGNSAAGYVAAWRHLHDVFAGAGVGNVRWVWSVNRSKGTTDLASLYPGDGYVDLAGIDGYNGGSEVDYGGWQSFEQVFGGTLAEVAAVTSKPVWLTEMASAERGGDKAAWMKDFFARLRHHPEVVGFTWFNFRKEADWRIESSPASERAFAAGLAATKEGAR
jgi:hypothetical protein